MLAYVVFIREGVWEDARGVCVCVCEDARGINSPDEQIRWNYLKDFRRNVAIRFSAAKVTIKTR